MQHPDPEPNRSIPDCAIAGTCQFSGVPDIRAFPDRGGRWAQVCDYYTLGLDMKGLSGMGQAQLLLLLNRAPCLCKVNLRDFMRECMCLVGVWVSVC